ncbi:MAG: glycosyltransferase family 2 protein, partial [Brevinema sp.]
MLLSIIVPVYNTEPYLRECLDSLINQKYTNIEIIIVNDCSPDNSDTIIQEYLQRDPRIQYIKHPQNLGLGGARNTGITHAKGEWITFIDSDDYIDLDTYSTMIPLITTNNADLGIFSVIDFNDHDKKESYNPYSDIPISAPTKLDIHYWNITVVVWNKIYRRSHIVDNNITFPLHLKHEDDEFWFKYRTLIEPIAVGNPQKFYHYRVRGNSITSQVHLSRLDTPLIYTNIYNFLCLHNLQIKYRSLFLQHLSDALISSYRVIPIEHKTLFENQIKLLLAQLNMTKEEWLQYPLLLDVWTDFITYNLQQDKEQLQQDKEQLQQDKEQLQQDKWYRFGQLSHKQKIKKIIVTF